MLEVKIIIEKIHKFGKQKMTYYFLAKIKDLVKIICFN